MFERDIVTTLQERLLEPRKFIQIVVGPRQTGKSTAVYQALEKTKSPIVQFSFDRPRDQNTKRLETVWEEARSLLTDSNEVILSLDEIQKVPDWSSTVKFLWDDDTFNKRNIKVILTGSSALTIKSGMAESLERRYEEFQSTQWTFAECNDAFGYSLDDFLFFGGYPGSALSY